jgi:hypothetical protein
MSWRRYLRVWSGRVDREGVAGSRWVGGVAGKAEKTPVWYATIQNGTLWYHTARDEVTRGVSIEPSWVEG